MPKARHVVAASITALFLLAACQPEDVVSGPADAQREQLAKAEPVTLPPAIRDSKTYRCKDNSLVYVDFHNDQKTAIFRTKRNDVPVRLSAPAPGEPFVAEGYSVSGSGLEITLTAPGKGTQSCKA